MTIRVTTPWHLPDQEAPSGRSTSQVLDRVARTFYDERAVAAAGCLCATTSQKTGLKAAADDLVGVEDRPGRNVATVTHATRAEADCIDGVKVRVQVRPGTCVSPRMIRGGLPVARTAGMGRNTGLVMRPRKRFVR